MNVYAWEKWKRIFHFFGYTAVREELGLKIKSWIFMRVLFFVWWLWWIGNKAILVKKKKKKNEKIIRWLN